MAFLRKLVRSHSFHFPLAHLFPRFLSDVPSSRIFPTTSFELLKTEGFYYLDKTHFIPKIEALGPAILSLRPRRFGKSLFISTLSSYYDVKNKGRFEQLFQDLYVGENPTPLASKFLVLRFDFSGLRTDALYEIFGENFHKVLNGKMKQFMDRYEQELGKYHFQVVDRDALANFRKLLEAVESSGNKIYIFIDEYDGSMNEALKNEKLFRALTSHYKNNDSKIELMEGAFKQFFSILKLVSDGVIARAFLTGVTPIVMAEFTSGFNISVDLTLKERFWDLYGFKKLDIKVLLDKAFGNDLSDNIKEEIISWLKEEHDGYFFHREQPEGIFNPARILYCITELMERKEILGDSWDLNTLINFPPDPQSLPAQTTLDLIVKNPLGKSILTEALCQRPLNSKQGIQQRFRLTNIRELAIDRTPLLSFMFYTGAITYQPDPSPASLQHNFRIPNRVAEREFIKEALKIYDWQKADSTNVRKCLQKLEAEHNIEPLCRFIEKTLLMPLKGNSVKHSNEETLKQTFMNTLILTLHVDVEPEFRVYSQSSNFGGKAIDLVKTSTGKMMAIEFDNIKMENVKLDGARGNWQKATEVSRSLLKKSEDEILSLEISDEYRSNQKTVREALEWKIKKKSNEYLDQLKKHNAELTCMFIVLRVGLHRLISRKVYCVDE